jgi:hypothetical protein
MVQSSMSKQYSGDSYFRNRTLFKQIYKAFSLTWILMPVPLYSSQPGVYSGLPQASLTTPVSQPIRGVQRSSRILRPLSVVVWFCSSLATPSGHGEKGHALKRWLPLRHSLGQAPTVRSPAFGR